MRLGVVGLVPNDFRAVKADHLDYIRQLRLSGVGVSANKVNLAEATPADFKRVRDLFAQAEMDLVQFNIGYSGPIFGPDEAQREDVLQTIERGIEVGREVNAQACLIRTGSLNPAGSYVPHRDNFLPENYERLLDSLRRVARKADAVGQTVIIETHQLIIMDSPETNRDVIETIGSDRLRIVMDYVNHFQTLKQVYDSTTRINQIFDVMGPICPVGHCKDIQLSPARLVLHIDEAIPGEGELDLATALHRWEALDSVGYMLVEHLPAEDYPQAARNVHRIAAEAGITIW